MIAVPSAPGTYALLLHLAHTRTLRVGRFGTFTFERGDYVYVGSAFGAGGLRERIERHLHDTKRVHWHIDSLLQYAQVSTIFYVTDKRMEHQWSQGLSRKQNAQIPVRGFGASDCRAGCAAHLIRFDSKISVTRLGLQLARLGTSHHINNNKLAMTREDSKNVRRQYVSMGNGR